MLKQTEVIVRTVCAPQEDLWVVTLNSPVAISQEDFVEVLRQYLDEVQKVLDAQDQDDAQVQN